MGLPVLYPYPLNGNNRSVDKLPIDLTIVYVHLCSDDNDYNYNVNFSVKVDTYFQCIAGKLENGLFKFHEAVSSLLALNGHKKAMGTVKVF